MRLKYSIFIYLFFLFFVTSCTNTSGNITNRTEVELLKVEHEGKIKKNKWTPVKGALLLSKFNSLEELKKVIDIEYFKGVEGAGPMLHTKPYVRISHRSGGQKVVSILQTGVNEKDILNAWVGTLWDRVWLGLNNPYLILNKRNLPRIHNMVRKRGTVFGEGDIAFFNIAEAMLENIRAEDKMLMSDRDLSEKGYINSFNHITSQAFMTSIFSERFANFVADSHERAHMPELITGDFSEEQIKDLDTGPVDNYVDIINNEWGQELGKKLSKQHNINKRTHWTPILMADYLNSIQRYFSWAFQIGFTPFKATDRLVITYANKLNIILNDTSGLRFKRDRKKNK